MSYNFSDEQTNRFAAFLDHQRICIISTVASQGVWAIPVRYSPLPETSSSSTKLVIDCLVPRWSDVAHHLDQDSSVVVIVQASTNAGLRWLQIQGTAQPIEAPDWSRLLPRWANILQPDAFYQVVRVTPSRIDLINEDRGWGVQETLEW